MSNSNQQEQSEYIRAKQAAKMIGIARPTFYTYLKKPDLEMPRGIKLAGAVVYSVVALRAWMQKRAAMSGGVIA
jgi:predicted DNA-binding transcriptional regulator AlpA